MKKKWEIDCKLYFINTSLEKTKSESRKMSFSHWKTTYNETNQNLLENKTSDTSSKIFDLYKPN